MPTLPKPRPSNSLLTAAAQVFQRVSIQTLALGVLGMLSLWASLRFAARQTLVVLIFTRNWGTKPLDYMIRLLGSLPTLILGNAILVLTGAMGLHPQNPIIGVLFILLTLTLIGLPTVLQIGQEVLKDYDKRQLQQAVALGISRIVIGKKVALPSVHRSFNAAVTIAISRIIIEGYIVLDRTLFASPTNLTIIRDADGLLDIFYGIYSTMTIQSNAVLILLLFVTAMLVNFWSFSITPTHKP